MGFLEKKPRRCGIFRARPFQFSAKFAPGSVALCGTGSALTQHVYRAVLVVVSLAVLMAAARAQERPTPSALREHPKIAYSTTRPTDPVARLNDQLAAGHVTLAHNDQHGYLESVLAALNVPVASQVLVFSKTSFQSPRINPRNPRALYFNDAVSVGWVRGGEVLEFAAQDPQQGTMFYTLDQSSGEKPRFVRNAACIACHTGEATIDVPGLFAGSNYIDSNGNTVFSPIYSTDHRTPFDLRWGGWYVTGTHRGRHLGNAIATNLNDVTTMATEETSHLDRLDGKFETTAWPVPTSDIVALLVLEHQMRMVNLMTRVGWEARVGMSVAGRPLDPVIEELVDYLLFVDEAELPGPVAGSSAFAKTFAQQAPRDARGRSLKDLDLGEHLFRYPCSYLIYSPQFEALPPEVREKIFARMYEILSGRDPDPRYRRLSEERRRAVVDILVATKRDLPAYFRGPFPSDTP
jgi:hypothetical protein